MRRAALVAALLLATAAQAADFQYVLTRRDRGTISGNVNVDVIVGMQDRWPGDFLWAHRDGAEYVIRDEDVIAAARAAFADVHALQSEYTRLRVRRQPIEQRHRALEVRLNRLSDERRMAELQIQMRPLENEMRVLDAEHRQIERRERERIRAAEAKLRDIVDRAIRGGIAERLR